MLPLDVLEEAAANLTNYKGCGESVLEMSHRSKVFETIIGEAEADLREIMGIPDNYKVLFLQGGATLQFSMVPMNLLTGSGKADYVITGTWAKKAWEEARKFGDIRVAASSEERNFTDIPKLGPDDFRRDADYVHITLNNTIYGTRYPELPDTGGIPLVADLSSCILSEAVDVSRFALIYAGAQKNVGPAGVTLVIVREDFLGKAPAGTPVYLDYKTHVDNGSMYNTPPCFPIYIAGEVFKKIKREGGIPAMEARNRAKAGMLYEYIDQSRLYSCPNQVEDRSLMNVVFVTGNGDLDKKFVSEAAKQGMSNLGGHRSIGGMRASIYNAMPEEGVRTLIAFMKEFEAANLPE
jgi:phosphoserine aminotransferase